MSICQICEDFYPYTHILNGTCVFCRISARLGPVASGGDGNKNIQRVLETISIGPAEDNTKPNEGNEGAS